MIHLNRSGTRFLTLAILSFATARIFAIPELYFLGTILTVALLFSIVFVLFMQPSCTAIRLIAEETIHAGDTFTVELQIHTNKNIRWLPLTITDVLETQTEDYVYDISALSKHEMISTRYHVSSPRRGKYSVGPLYASTQDPFGLCTRSKQVLDIEYFLVLPQIVDIQPLHFQAQIDNSSNESSTFSTLSSQGEFHVLRTYQPGDDMRRVHWPSTAKTGEVMIRQDEQLHKNCIHVLIHSYIQKMNYRSNPDSFELLVLCAASTLSELENQNNKCFSESILISNTTIDGITQESCYLALQNLALLQPHSSSTKFIEQTSNADSYGQNSARNELYLLFTSDYELLEQHVEQLLRVNQNLEIIVFIFLDEKNSIHFPFETNVRCIFVDSLSAFQDCWNELWRYI